MSHCPEYRSYKQLNLKNLTQSNENLKPEGRRMIKLNQILKFMVSFTYELKRIHNFQKFLPAKLGIINWF